MFGLDFHRNSIGMVRPPLQAQLLESRFPAFALSSLGAPRLPGLNRDSIQLKVQTGDFRTVLQGCLCVTELQGSRYVAGYREGELWLVWVGWVIPTLC